MSLSGLMLSKALFNVMLREFGVKGVKVQEVVSLDEEMMAFLNKPVYGLIFLFRWREDDPNKQEASCPEGLWFANQTTSNACASVALLNIVNNIEGIELGENLQHFKNFTMPFTPALRGDAINNFEFVKRIHNSFARKMDMLNSDLLLKYEATSKRSRLGKYTQDENEMHAGFHFIAFVPALGTVWKFDGLERQPQALGHYTSDDDWLDLVKPNIRTKMEEYEEGQIEFSILSLTQDPLPNLIGGSISESTFAEQLQEAIIGPDESYGLTRERIDQSEIPTACEEEYGTLSNEDLLQHRQHLVAQQQSLRITIREEQQSLQADDDYAAGRRYDYGPAVRAWVRSLARKRIIENLAYEKDKDLGSMV
ncbi:hypothetical protein EYZ11_011289 [Aspergillus tanneri]|uniref:Ubiquitin carboxyl-terminal hydrolase n=1 Tax=Aspergillus tanneri TaxID=1220188 RepID=A0A4S3J359_9EURO|nr:hypothetical protein EYZ11_011289 [Aspergillus tanneri]